jgi:hypothetical protein
VDVRDLRTGESYCRRKPIGRRPDVDRQMYLRNVVTVKLFFNESSIIYDFAKTIGSWGHSVPVIFECVPKNE